MTGYSFVTVWKLRAPLEDVWKIIQTSQEWPGWWKGVLEVTEIVPGDANTIGNVSDHTWKSYLPYRIHMRSTVVKVQPMEFMEGTATGDLEGTGRWYFSHVNGITTVRYEWDVRTTKAWMNFFSPMLRMVFKWNHDVVMRWGGEGLAKKLHTTLLQ